MVSVHNPYGCSDTSTLSMYRRPLPSTNLKFLSGVMWDARESTPPSTQKITGPADLQVDLAHQAMDAVAGHAQGATPLSAQLQQQIVAFETNLYTAQAFDCSARDHTEFGATGGPNAVASQQFYIGINDPLGGNPTGAPFTSTIFNLFKSWANTPGFGASARASVSRGEVVFNTKPINITGVAGLNDTLNAHCHPGNLRDLSFWSNAGDHSVGLPINIGVADTTNSLGVRLPSCVHAPKNIREQPDGADRPVRIRALITGKWADIGKFKGPVLRGLASRAPYFHNGSAATLDNAVDFYNTRFAIGLTAQERSGS